MATPRYGFSSAVNNSAPKLDRRTSTNNTVSIISSRVKDIILDNTHPRFVEFGEWNGIGTIFIESTKNPLFSDQIPLIPAYPAFPNIKQYPLINEVVPIIYLTDTDVTENTTSVSAYYLPPVNVWNSQIHNAIPSTNVLPASLNIPVKPLLHTSPHD
jgi:nitrate reductase beta subunit